jgi:hypothetical protein
MLMHDVGFSVCGEIVIPKFSAQRHQGDRTVMNTARRHDGNGESQAGPSRYAHSAAARYPFRSPFEQNEDASSSRSRVAVTDEVGMISSHSVSEHAFGKQRKMETERAFLQEQGLIPKDTPVEFGTRHFSAAAKGKQKDFGDVESYIGNKQKEPGFWEKSKQRAKSDRSSWDYGRSSELIELTCCIDADKAFKSFGVDWLAESQAVS